MEKEGCRAVLLCYDLEQIFKKAPRNSYIVYGIYNFPILGPPQDREALMKSIRIIEAVVFGADEKRCGRSEVTT